MVGIAELVARGSSERERPDRRDTKTRTVSGSRLKRHVIGRPDELSPVALSDLDPSAEAFLGTEELGETHEQPTVDCLAVAAAITMPRRTAEIKPLGVGGIRIESR
jgi:hypothetical protein